MSRAKLIFVVNEAQFLVSHRLPLLREAQRRGFDVLVACAAGTGEGALTELGIAFETIPLSRSGFNPWQEFKTYLALKHLYRRQRPDIVHHVTIKPVIYGAAAARREHVPAVVNAVPGMGFVFTRRGLLAATRRVLVNMLYRVAFRHPNFRVIFQNTDDMQGFLDHSIIERSKTVLIRGSGVDLNDFVAVPESSDPVIFLMVSRMLQHKGVREFVSAAERLGRIQPSWRFQLVGDVDEGNPSSLSRLELQEWHDRGVIEWLGKRDDIPQCMAQCHVVVLPSYREGLPKVLLEASAVARPMIATDVAGCREVVRPHVNGLLVPPRDAARLAQAMEQLGSDPALRARFGQAAREKAEAVFSVDDVVHHTFLVYQQLLPS